MAASRRYVRDVQAQAQLQRLAGGGAEEGEASDLAAALRQQEQADRYISSFLARRGGWSKWQKTARVQSSAAAQGGGGGGSAPPQQAARPKAPADKGAGCREHVMQKFSKQTALRRLECP